MGTQFIKLKPIQLSCLTERSYAAGVVTVGSPFECFNTTKYNDSNVIIDSNTKCTLPKGTKWHLHGSLDGFVNSPSLNFVNFQFYDVTNSVYIGSTGARTRPSDTRAYVYSLTQDIQIELRNAGGDQIDAYYAFCDITAIN